MLTEGNAVLSIAETGLPQEFRFRNIKFGELKLTFGEPNGDFILCEACKNRDGLERP